MRVVIAPDKFKGSLTAVEAARAMAEGVRDADPGAEVVLCPMADGGEGTVEVVAAAAGAEIRSEKVKGPLPGQEVTAQWALLRPGWPGASAGGLPFDHGKKTAFIEMAQASGLWLLSPDRRDPMVATTYGTGQLIKAALREGCWQVIVGVGGSATVDGGTGMARALGYRFLDGEGLEVPTGGGSLERIREIDAAGVDKRLGETTFFVASDVVNPLLGPEGAARVYGPQKGADAQEVLSLERGLGNLAEVIRWRLGVDVEGIPGAGAAGGLGAGLVAFCGAAILSGFEVVACLVDLAAGMRGADLVLTGEGSFDVQTGHGKAPMGVVRVASENGIPAVVLSGRVARSAERSLGKGVVAFSIIPEPMSLDEAMGRAEQLLVSGTTRLIRILRLLEKEDS